MQNFSGWIAEEWTACEKLARRRAAAVGAVAGGSCALLAVALLWGFSVDDAWIVARVAANLAAGHGHRFNPDGPVVDAVTPFGFAHLVQLLGAGTPLAAFGTARLLSASAFVVAAILLGLRVGAAGRRGLRFFPLGMVLISIGMPAWAVAGMETGLIVALVVLGVGSRLGHAGLLGVAAAWRPELLPFALTMAVGAGFAQGGGVRGALSRAILCLLPAAAMVAMRLHVFGVSYPLSFVAKPSDLEHGLRYALGGAVFTGALPLLSAISWQRMSGMGRVRLCALCAHGLALVFAGGDWMPLYRLWCPVLPVAALLAAEAFESASFRRASLAGGLCLLLTWVPLRAHLQSARAVEARRLALVSAAAPLLRGARVVAALDVGWVGLATPARVVDLAGVTDPEVARLPGGHTSKRLPPDFARRRQVDSAIVLMSPGAAAARGEQITPELGSRAVERRLLLQLSGLGFRNLGSIPLGGTEQSYLVLRRDAHEKWD
jgi:hypothetical protein